MLPAWPGWVVAGAGCASRAAENTDTFPFPPVASGRALLRWEHVPLASRGLWQSAARSSDRAGGAGSFRNMPGLGSQQLLTQSFGHSSLVLIEEMSVGQQIGIAPTQLEKLPWDLELPFGCFPGVGIRDCNCLLSNGV